ncbi:MAG TPA: LiaF domain-containing protein, partial [Nocardioidaceae bacterium]|nr:LiaF domain-containing protein [Nocardioidaceae bacterium]
LLIPDEGEEYGIVDRHFPASADVEQIRRVGLFAAAAIAAVSAIGSGYAFGAAGLPIAIVVLVVFYVFAIRPYNRRQAQRAATAHGTATVSQAGAGADTLEAPDGSGPAPEAGLSTDDPRHDRGTLFGVTVAAAAVVLGAMWIYSAQFETIDWPYFPLAALFVVAAGMLTGAYFGNGRPLAWLGVPLALLLLTTPLLPSYTFGDEKHHAAYAAELDDEYTQGVGNFVLDLSGVTDLPKLDGHTIDVEQGIGNIEIIVPDDLDVEVEAETDAGQLHIFARSADGSPATLHYLDPSATGPELKLDISQTAGQIKVRRP